LTSKDNIVNEIPGNEGLWKSKQGSEDDDENTYEAFAPVTFNKWTEIIKIGLDAGITFLSSDAVLRQFPGKPMFQKAKPTLIHGLSSSVRQTESVHEVLFKPSIQAADIGEGKQPVMGRRVVKPNNSGIRKEEM
jgi:hypothetical protein